MTTFATSFSQFPSMQVEEDIMEVSNDPDRKNAMEEDQFDIDLDLADEPQADQDEDSMMDDEPAGHEGDQDQHMNDDYQEHEDQDDVIVDYVEDVSTVLEVPMAEPTHVSQEQSAGQPEALFNTEIVPETPALVSFASQQSFSEPVVPATELPLAQDQTKAHEPVSVGTSQAAEDGENLESIRSLFNEETRQIPGSATVDDHSRHANLENYVQDLTSDTARPLTEEQPGALPSTRRDDANHDPLLDTSHATIADGNKDDEKATTPVPPTDSVATNVSATETNPAPQTNETSSDYTSQERADKDEPNAVSETFSAVATEAVTGDHQDEENPVADGPEPPIRVLVEWGDLQLSLVPPTTDNDSSPEMFLLPDKAVFDLDLDALIDTCRDALQIESSDELELTLPSFHLTFRKHDPEAARYTLRDFGELCVQLQQNDGSETPEPLEMRLTAKRCLASHIDSLYELVKESRGMRHVASLFTAKADTNLDSQAEVNDPADAKTGAKADAEDDLPEIPEDDLGFDDWDDEEHAEQQPASESVNPRGQDVSTAAEVLEEKDAKPSQITNRVVSSESPEDASESQSGGPEQSIVSHGAPGTDQSSVSADTQTASRPTDENDAQTDPADVATSAHETEKETELAQDAQTAGDLDFGDDDWGIEDSAATEVSTLTEAQKDPTEPMTDASQSLHSATQPDGHRVADSPTADGALPEPEPESEGDPNQPPVESDASSTTLQGAPDVPTGSNEAADEEDLFDDEDDYSGVDHVNDAGDINDDLDFGPDEEQLKSPSLKRIRSEIEEAAGEAEDDEVHPLKRSRSG